LSRIAAGPGSCANASSARRTGSIKTDAFSATTAWELEIAPPIPELWMRQCQAPSTTGSTRSVTSRGSVMWSEA
jgi:hypothetical protein